MDKVLPQILSSNLTLSFIALIIIVFIWGFVQYNRAEGIENKINVSSKIPPILVSIGMLGTFVGILISLASFSEGFQSNAPEISLNSAMSDFIGGMFVAFASSVFGLAFSLLYRIIIDFITEPHRLSEQGEKEADVTDLLVKMTEVKDAISNGDDDSSLLSQMRFLRTDMSDKFSALQNSFESFQKQMSENNIKALVEAVQKVMDDFNNKINDNLGETFNRLNSSVEQLVKWQDEYKTYLEDAKLRLEQAKDGINKVQENLKSISASMETLPERAASIEIIVNRLGDQINELESRLEAFKDMKEKAINAMPAIENNINDLTDGFRVSIDKVSQKIIKSTDSMGELVTTSLVGMKDISKVLKDSVKVSTDEIKASLETQKTEMTGMATKLSEGLKSSTKETSVQIKASLETQKTEMTGMATKLSEDLKISTKETSVQIKASLETQKTEMTGMAEEVAENISDSTTAMEKSIKVHIESLNNLSSEIKQTTEASLETLTERMEEQIVKANINMQNVQKQAIQSMGTSLTSLSQKFVDDYTPLTEKLKETVRIAKNINNET